MEKVVFISKKDILQLPKTSGVYLFYSGKELIYIGKAINLKERARNHFQQPSYRDNLFITQVDRIGYIETNSEVEALLLEAQLIKQHMPKYNVLWKDDKKYFYVAFSPAESGLPYLFLTHQKIEQKTEFIGPFIEGKALKKVLKFLRKPFPYYSAKKHPRVKCMYCHLDLCPGPTPDAVAYKKDIKRLILILKGQRSRVLSDLRKEMAQLAKNQDFEAAGHVRDRMVALQRIMDHTHVIENSYQTGKPEALESLRRIIGSEQPILKVECYDISNIQGKQATGSMVVSVNGMIEKSQYKKFRIRMKQEPNDIAMLKEVFTRRLTHPEWGYPQVMLIDGGIAQLNAAITIKNEHPETQSIRVISIAKGKRELFIEGQPQPIPLKHLPQDVYNLIVHMDDEAHRFAVSYHTKLRKKNLLK